MSRRTRVLAAVLGALLVAVLLASDLAAARMAFALAICLLLPGLGWARKMRFGDLGDTLALATVLSICMTVAVGTTMVLARSWSLGWGLASLGGLALAGFLPTRLLLDRAGAAVRLRLTPAGDDGGVWAAWYEERRRKAAVAASEATAVWVDWYADVKRRAEQTRARDAAARQVAVDEWIAWYQRTHLLTKRHQDHGGDQE